MGLTLKFGNKKWIRKFRNVRVLVRWRSYLLVITSVSANPVTTAFDIDELMLTGPSPWKILMRFNFIGSIVWMPSKPSMPLTNSKKKLLKNWWMLKCRNIVPVTNFLNKDWILSLEHASKFGSSIWHVFMKSSENRKWKTMIIIIANN